MQNESYNIHRVIHEIGVSFERLGYEPCNLCEIEGLVKEMRARHSRCDDDNCARIVEGETMEENNTEKERARDYITRPSVISAFEII